MHLADFKLVGKPTQRVAVGPQLPDQFDLAVGQPGAGIALPLVVFFCE